MSYKLDIKDDALKICGLFGIYEAADDGNGGFWFLFSRIHA